MAHQPRIQRDKVSSPRVVGEGFDSKES